jgi:hypothetical protein
VIRVVLKCPRHILAPESPASPLRHPWLQLAPLAARGALLEAILPTVLLLVAMVGIDVPIHHRAVELKANAHAKNAKNKTKNTQKAEQNSRNSHVTGDIMWVQNS